MIDFVHADAISTIVLPSNVGASDGCVWAFAACYDPGGKRKEKKKAKWGTIDTETSRTGQIV